MTLEICGLGNIWNCSRSIIRAKEGSSKSVALTSLPFVGLFGDLSLPYSTSTSDYSACYTVALYIFNML